MTAMVLARACGTRSPTDGIQTFIDAPEMGQAFGDEARNFLRGLIAGRTLRLDPIAKASMKEVPFDLYRRILCMGFLTEEMGAGRIHYFVNGQCGSGTVKDARSVTRNIELEMIVNGWAWVVDRYSFEREAEYVAAQADAQLHRRGLWQMDNPEPPWDFKRRQKRLKLAKEKQASLI